MKVTYLAYKVDNNEYMVKINRKSGGINHFYHFIVDLVWPLYHSMEQNNVHNKQIVSCVTNDKEAIYFVEHFKQIFGVPIRRNPMSILKRRFQHGTSMVTLDGFNSKRRDYLQVFDSVEDLRKSRNGLRSYLLGAFGIDTSLVTSRLVILIERKLSVAGGGAQRRSISNHKELKEKISIHCRLNKIDFQNVELSELSFEEQVTLFSGNNVTVLGQHGAGLIHLMWLGNSEKCRLIELSGEPKDHFKNLSNDLGVPYDHILCDEDIATEGIFVNANDILKLI